MFIKRNKKEITGGYLISVKLVKMLDYNYYIIQRNAI